MSENKVKNSGRLYYVEPNDLYNSLPNGIPHPYEDYCISVDLVVEFGNRNSLGPVGSASGVRGEYTFSSDKGTINFIGGTNGFLTTNFTDIHSTNVNGNTNECLGIESINVAYNSWYVPQVSIKFVDVRGASLMGPQEQGYIQTIRSDLATGHKGNTSIEGGSFFKALFSFPYPVFKLKVKGFYGKEVTYNLAVEDFKGSFNGDNGNFEVDVRFIGYMFGVYTDIPMNYLMVAPFFPGVGEKYWEQQKENGRFTYSSHLPFYTYPDLIEKIDQLKPEEMDVQSSDGTENLSEKKRQLENKLAALGEIRESLAFTFGTLFDGGFDFPEYAYKIRNGNVEVPEGVKYDVFGICTYVPNKIEKNRYFYRNLYASIVKDRNFNDNFDSLYRKVMIYNEKYNNELSVVQMNTYFGLRQDNTCMYIVRVDSSNGDYSVWDTYRGRYAKDTPDEDRVYYSSTLPDRKHTVNEWISAKIRNNGFTKGKLFTFMQHADFSVVPEWAVKIDEKIDKLNKELAGLQEQIQNRVNDNVGKLLGFPISIENVFNMAFGHMETFMEIFYHYLNEIKNQQQAGNRSLDKLRFTNVKNTDLSSGFSKDSQIPPFTLFYKETETSGGASSSNEFGGKKKVVMWPGDLKDFGADTSALPEIDFVNRLLKAAKGYGELSLQYENLRDSANDVTTGETSGITQEYLPTTAYDLAYLGQSNPYSYISNLLGGNKHWEAMLVTFITRFFYWYGNRAATAANYDKWKTSAPSIAFGYMEAYNVFKAYPTILTTIKEWLVARYTNAHSYDALVKEVIDYLKEDSKDEDRKFYDIGKGSFNKHYIKQYNGGYYYDWMTPVSYEKKMPDGSTVQLEDVKHIPIGNDCPLNIDTTGMILSNKKVAIIDKPSTRGSEGDKDKNENYYNTDTIVFLETEVSDFKKSKLTYTDVLKNKINDANISLAYKSLYETGNAEGVIPNFQVPGYVVNIRGNNIKQFGYNEAVSVVSSKRIWSKNLLGIEMPHDNESNSDSFYLNAPAFISVFNKTKTGSTIVLQTTPGSMLSGLAKYVKYYPHYPLYGHPIFYKQSEISDSEQRKYAKAFLFATGTLVRGNEEWSSKPTSVFPFFAALWEGAHWFRRRWMREHKDSNGNMKDLILLPNEYIYSDYDHIYAPGCLMSKEYVLTNIHVYPETFYLIKKEDLTKAAEQEALYASIDTLTKSGNDAKALADFFQKWADEEFPDLNNIFELKSYNYEKFKDKVEEFSKKKKFSYKIGDVFTNIGDYDRRFYDRDAEISVKDGEAFELRAIPVSDLQNNLLKLFRKYVVLIDTGKLFRCNLELAIPQKTFVAGIESFLRGLFDIYKNQLENPSLGVETNGLPPYDPTGDVDLKISTYLTLKNLYDRWICMTKTKDKWRLGVGDKSEFSHFKYIDGFYREIGNRIPVSMSYITEIASQMVASSNVTNDATNLKYQGRSFYDFLASICQKNQMMLLSLPMENEFTDAEGIADLFDVKSYSKMDERDTSCFVCLYSNKPSQHLEIEYDNDEYLYGTDGFNIANAKGEIVDATELLPQFMDTTASAYKIPAFGVTYGKQNQSIFKKVDVNMQNPQVTEASIAATQYIASKQDSGPNKNVLYGQDLYRIYANYSYTCTVEMLGNAQIMPLMYFQLNNIPLFRGTYMIINIEHNIVAGNMTTKFTGVRMSRFENPLVSDCALLSDPAVETNYRSPSQTGTQPGDPTPPISDEQLAAIKAATKDGPHKYTIEANTDLLWSNTASEKGYSEQWTPDNDDVRIKPNLDVLQTILQGVQDAWVEYCAQNSDKPWSKYDGIYISSGYRCEDLNKAVGSKEGRVDIMPEISVVMPVYNAERFLEDTTAQ